MCLRRTCERSYEAWTVSSILAPAHRRSNDRGRPAPRQSTDPADGPAQAAHAPCWGGNCGHRRWPRTPLVGLHPPNNGRELESVAPGPGSRRTRARQGEPDASAVSRASDGALLLRCSQRADAQGYHGVISGIHTAPQSSGEASWRWSRPGALSPQQRQVSGVGYYGVIGGEGWASCHSVVGCPCRCRLRHDGPECMNMRVPIRNWCWSAMPGTK